MPSLPLFPLQTILFPGISMPLQIFEQRYLNLVSESLREGTGFGIVLIKEGGEVGAVSKIFPVGVQVAIVDWYQQDNNLLGIRVLAERKFRVLSTTLRGDHLLIGEVEYLPPEPAVPLDSFGRELATLVAELKQHPALAGYELPNVTDLRTLGWQLAQLLPIGPREKIALLELADPRERVGRIARWLERTAADN